MTREFDSEFEQYRSENPGATFAEFYTRRVASRVATGEHGHNSLGGNIVRSASGESQEFWEAGEKQANRLIRLFEVEPGERVVEYGCGSLRVAAHFLEYLEPDSFFGLDVIGDFIEIGRELVGPELIERAQPRLEVISEESVAAAAAFAPDFVFSFSVLCHVHPDEIDTYVTNLKAIASKPGARLGFNAILSEPSAREDRSTRYANIGWAWPQEEILSKFEPLEFVKLDGPRPVKGKESDGLQAGMFEFRAP